MIVAEAAAENSIHWSRSSLSISPVLFLGDFKNSHSRIVANSLHLLCSEHS